MIIGSIVYRLDNGSEILARDLSWYRDVHGSQRMNGVMSSWLYFICMLLILVSLGVYLTIYTINGRLCPIVLTMKETARCKDQVLRVACCISRSNFAICKYFNIFNHMATQNWLGKSSVMLDYFSVKLISCCWLFAIFYKILLCLVRAYNLVLQDNTWCDCWPEISLWQWAHGDVVVMFS